ncbi:hypothetical protein VTO42DRAFT_4891 [Malbranchea cinnamomea]
MPISELPRATISAIGSTSALSDSCAVVKELVDNALDANATSISIEISHNTLDVIQVRDNGSGILPDDRGLACRPSCTSKIRTLEDLRDVGPRSLGFRGLALASIAEMSGAVAITTRVDGEPVGAVLRYDRAGELVSRVPAAHPIGTTVRVSDFLKNLPVRRKAMLKDSTKIIAKMKKVLCSYAVSRPSIRLSLKVLGTKVDNNWVYPGKEGSCVLDAMLKLAGSDVSSQCITKEIEMPLDPENDATHYIRIAATLPKTDADLHKVGKCGQFICVDGRPLSLDKGIAKTLAKTYKSYIRSKTAQLQLKTTISDPFLCLHIFCPPGCYDPNVEPGKDDVLFESPALVVSAVEKLLKEVYGITQETFDESGEIAPETESPAGPPNYRQEDTGLEARTSAKSAVFFQQLHSPNRRLTSGGGTIAERAGGIGLPRNTGPTTVATLVRANGPANTATEDANVQRSLQLHTPVSARNRLPLTPVTRQRRLSKSSLTTPNFSGSSSARMQLGSSPVSKVARGTPSNVNRQRDDADESYASRVPQGQGNGTLDSWLQLSPRPSPIRNRVELNSTGECRDDDLTVNERDLNERFGTLGSSGQQSEEVPVPSPVRTNSGLSSPSSFSNSLGQPARSLPPGPVSECAKVGNSQESIWMPPLEEALEFERRKKQAIQYGRQILSSSNPYFNRLQAALRRTVGESPNVNFSLGRGANSEQTTRNASSALGSLVTRNRASAQVEPQADDDGEHLGTRLGLTSRLSLYHLSFKLTYHHAHVTSMVHALSPYDVYIRTGVDSFDLVEYESSDVMQGWTMKLRQLVLRSVPPTAPSLT